MCSQPLDVLKPAIDGEGRAAGRMAGGALVEPVDEGKVVDHGRHGPQLVVTAGAAVEQHDGDARPLRPRTEDGPVDRDALLRCGRFGMRTRHRRPRGLPGPAAVTTEMPS